tara:strand:+ start:1150 stop:1335 length:186 start_codon:yes stop_codon:yes gene_type:complete
MGKLKLNPDGTYSTTGTKASDWGVDPSKPYRTHGDTYKFSPTKGLKKAKKKKPKGPNSVNA